MAEIAKNYSRSQNIDLNAINIFCTEKIEDGESILSECTIKFNKNDIFVKGNRFRSGRRMLIHLPDSKGTTVTTIKGPFGIGLKGTSIKNASEFDIDMID